MSRWIVAAFTLTFAAQPVAAQEDNASSEAYVTQVAPALGPTQRVSRSEALGLIYTRLWTERDRSALDAYRNRGAADGSFALVNQFGERNTALVSQRGRSNLAVLYQRGSDNASALEQIGTGNLFGSYLTGIDNQTRVRQQGDNNIYALDFVGDNLRHATEQIGSNNQAVQTGRGTVPFNIEQRGNSMQMIIRHR